MAAVAVSQVVLVWLDKGLGLRGPGFDSGGPFPSPLFFLRCQLRGHFTFKKYICNLPYVFRLNMYMLLPTYNTETHLQNSLI